MPAPLTLDSILGPCGSLAGALPGYEQRHDQLAMAREVDRALTERRYLVVEAGTGTGKTLAYLVPAILSGRRVVVSTATKNLQDQLFRKDLHGTLLVNLVGCLLIGYLYGQFLLRPEVPLALRAGLIVGFLGGLTTFSSFSLDTLRLLESGQILLAFGYLAFSVLGGLLATWGGLTLTKL